MRHSRKPELCPCIISLPIKAIKKSRRRGSVKTSVMEAQTYSGHRETKRLSAASLLKFRCGKVFHNGVGREESQAVTQTPSAENSRIKSREFDIELASSSCKFGDLPKLYV